MNIHAATSVRVIAGVAVPISVAIVWSNYHFLISGFVLSETLYFERQLLYHVNKMSYSMGKATLLQISSTSDHETAMAEKASALKDAEIGEESIRESIVMKEKSQKDRAKALVLEESGEAWEEKAAVEQEQAAFHEAKALEEEISYDALVAEAEAESAMVARDEELAIEDLEATTACEFIPFLDLLCDIVGGATEVGLHAKAAEEAAVALEDFTAAAGVKEEEEVEQSLAIENEAVSAKDSITASQYEMRAKEKFEMAQSESIASESLREDGKKELAKSTEERATSTVQEAKSIDEEALSQRALKDAAIHGVNCLFSGAIIFIGSILLLCHYSFKYILGLFFLIFKNSRSYYPLRTTPICNEDFGIYILEIFSFFILHLLMVLTTYEIFYHDFSMIDDISIRERGKMICYFSLCCALLHCITLQIIHRLGSARSKYENFNSEFAFSSAIIYIFGILVLCMFEFLKDFIFFMALCCIEVIISLLASLKGFNFLTISTLSWWICPFTFAYLLIHLSMFRISSEQNYESTSIALPFTEQYVSSNGEKEALLISPGRRYNCDNTDNIQVHKLIDSRNIGLKFEYEFRLSYLLFPFEVLTILLMMKVIHESLPYTHILRPVLVNVVNATIHF